MVGCWGRTGGVEWGVLCGAALGLPSAVINFQALTRWVPLALCMSSGTAAARPVGTLCSAYSSTRTDFPPSSPLASSIGALFLVCSCTGFFWGSARGGDLLLRLGGLGEVFKRDFGEGMFCVTGTPDALGRAGSQKFLSYLVLRTLRH